MHEIRLLFLFSTSFSHWGLTETIKSSTGPAYQGVLKILSSMKFVVWLVHEKVSPRVSIAKWLEVVASIRYVRCLRQTFKSWVSITSISLEWEYKALILYLESPVASNTLVKMLSVIYEWSRMHVASLMDWWSSNALSKNVIASYYGRQTTKKWRSVRKYLRQT